MRRAAASSEDRSGNFKPVNRKLPESISDLLSKTLGSHQLRKKAQEYAAFPYWKQIVGEEISQVAVPEKIVRGRVLHVRVVDAVWAQELSLMKKSILDGIRTFGKGAIVEDIKFVIGSPKSVKA